MAAQKHNGHPLRPLHKFRLYSFIALGVVLAGIQIVANVPTKTLGHNGQVLAYATNVNIGDLLAATNQERAVHGLSPLSLNAKLNNGAQAKAQDMVNKNYWSHNAPDGTQPWAFFINYGYQYQRAGENLAYGFDTSHAAVDGWMNSAGHKANVLGAYQDVGFGIASGAGYQGNENTVIVAFYALPYVPPTPTPAPVTPAPSPTPAVASAPTPEPVAPAAQEPPETQAQTPANEPQTPPAAQNKQSATTQEPKRVTTLESILTGNATWAMYASIGAMGVTSIGFAGTHLRLIRRGWRMSRHYILVHPAVDAAVLAALLATLLSSTSGFIK